MIHFLFLSIFVLVQCGLKNISNTDNQNLIDGSCIAGRITETSQPNSPDWIDEVPPTRNATLSFVGISSKRSSLQDALRDARADAILQIATYIGIEVSGSRVVHKDVVVENGRMTVKQTVEAATTFDLDRITGQDIKEIERFFRKRQSCLSAKEALGGDFEAAVLMEVSERSIDKARTGLDMAKSEALLRKKEQGELEERKKQRERRLQGLDRRASFLRAGGERNGALRCYRQLLELTGAETYRDTIAEIEREISAIARLKKRIRIEIIETGDPENINTGMIQALIANRIATLDGFSSGSDGLLHLNGTVSIRCSRAGSSFGGFFCLADGDFRLFEGGDDRAVWQTAIKDSKARDPIDEQAARLAVCEVLVERLWAVLVIQLER